MRKTKSATPDAIDSAAKGLHEADVLKPVTPANANVQSWH